MLDQLGNGLLLGIIISVASVALSLLYGVTRIVNFAHGEIIALGAIATLLTACAVSIGGLIGFIGLIVPHFSRLLIGNDFKYILPFSALIGALTLSSADLLSRLGPIEIPVGIVTALVGAPIFMIILYKKTGYKK